MVIGLGRNQFQHIGQGFARNGNGYLFLCPRNEGAKQEKGRQENAFNIGNPAPAPLVQQCQRPLGTVNPSKPNEAKRVSIEYLVRVSFTKVINRVFTLSNDEEYRYSYDKKDYDDNAKRQQKRIKDLKISVNMGEYFNSNNVVNPYDFTVILEQINWKEEEKAANTLHQFRMIKTNAGYRAVFNPYYRPY